MDILRVKKAQLPVAPPPSGRKRKGRKVVSAAAVTENDSQRDATTEVGSSTGPGNLGTTTSADQDSDEDESSDSD